MHANYYRPITRVVLESPYAGVIGRYCMGRLCRYVWQGDTCAVEG
jgi:hypothetical protein